VYLLRAVDKNWFEGEHHGLVGRFPVTYVEARLVCQSQVQQQQQQVKSLDLNAFLAPNSRYFGSPQTATLHFVCKRILGTERFLIYGKNKIFCFNNFRNKA